MSLEYDLYLDTRTPGPDVLELLAELHGLKPKGDGFQGPGLSGRVFAVSPERRETLREGLGVEPTVCVSFRVSLAPGDQDREEGHRGVRGALESSLALLDRIPGPAVFIFNGESPVFLRTRSALTLNNAKGFWSGWRLELVKGRIYEFADLPGL